MDELYSNKGNFIRAIRKAKCKRMLTKIVLENLISINLIQHAFREGAEGDIAYCLSKLIHN